MDTRKDALVTGKIYHILNKSIAGYTIFCGNDDFSRAIITIKYYQSRKPPLSLSRLLMNSELENKDPNEIIASLEEEMVVEIIAYCIMPTHYHILIKQLKDNGVSSFASNIQNSYARYFNTKYNRKGPLWEGKFKNVLVKTDEQLLHLTRYIHLNPVTAYLTDKPEKWGFSSYKEYLDRIDNHDKICNCSELINMDADQYKTFVEDRIAYQRELATIRKQLLD